MFHHEDRSKKKAVGKPEKHNAEYCTEPKAVVRYANQQHSARTVTMIGCTQDRGLLADVTSYYTQHRL